MDKFKLELRSFVKKAMKVAADIGSEEHYILMRNPNGEESKVYSIKNNREGFEKLTMLIESQCLKWNLQSVAFGMESTGSYTDGIGTYLTDRGVKVVLVNGYHTKRIKEISDNSPLKSDLKDPRVIADLMDLGNVMEYWKPEGAAAEIRQLNFHRERVMRKRIVSMNQMNDILNSLFPEFKAAAGDLYSKTALYLIENGFHNPEMIQKADQNDLALRLRKISMGQKGIKTVSALLKAAKETIGVVAGKNTLIRSVIFHARDIIECDREIKNIEKEMGSLLDGIEYSKYLLSIKGIGLITVACLVGEVGDFNRFKNIREIEKYAGLNLYEVSSGKHNGQRRITKRGRCYLRKCLYLAALSQVRCNPLMKEWYANMKNKGKNSISGLIAVARKLLRLCYGVVKSASCYNDEIWKRKIKKAA